MTDEELIKQARSEYLKRWREKNREHVRIYQKRYRNKKKLQANERTRQWRHDNPDRVREYEERYWLRVARGQVGEN